MKTKVIIQVLAFFFLSIQFLYGQWDDNNPRAVDWDGINPIEESESIPISGRDSDNLKFTIKNLISDSIKIIELIIKCDGMRKDSTVKIQKNDFSRSLKILDNKHTEIDLIDLFSKKFEDGQNPEKHCKIDFKIIADKTFTFVLDMHAIDNQERNTTKTVKHITQIPIPEFNSLDNDSLFDKRKRKNRYLVIDAHPDLRYKQNSILLKRNNKSEDNAVAIFKEAKALPIHSSLSVLIRNYNFSTLENITISINGIDYQYEDDINFLFKPGVQPKETQPIAGIQSDNGIEDRIQKEGDIDTIKKYLDEAYTLISKNEFWNINDLYKLNNYKTMLLESDEIQKNLLSTEAAKSLGKILYWSPQYVSLTPIALEVPKNDEVKITAKVVKEDKKPEEFPVGTYKTSGGMAFSVSSLFYVTGLKNNEVYTKQVQVNDSTKELRATMDSTNQMSVGIGLNAEINFRTGCLLRPTLNVGFFVPLGQELTPFIAVGPGISIGNKNVKFSLNGGLAFGQINVIAERYRDTDLSTFPDLINDDLSHKVWKPSWYVGLGVSFNIVGK